MAHQTFKVCILVDSNVENFYIKHYIDQINPVFNRFKNQVFTRNPLVNSPNLKIYWIDGENDQILVACEEDFRLFLEEGKGRKIFFSVSNNVQQQSNEEEDFVPMEAENIEPEKKCKKNHKEDEKRCRRFEKLSKKVKHYEDTYKNEEERSRSRHSEKRDMRNNERLERAKRRIEQIRSIVGNCSDPANLNATVNNDNHAEQPSTSSSSNDSSPMPASISPETIRLLSNTIAQCLQPCNVINKVLNEVFAIIPQVMEQTSEVMNNVGQQQTNEVPKNTTATNTSDANTPVPSRQANQEIEQLFKEAAKELEKMNEIVNNNNKMEGSSSSGTSQVTQIERVFQNINDSAISDATIVDNMNESQSDQADYSVLVDKSFGKDDFKIATPAKSIRSRESSIEIYDATSDDSREWTMLSQDELSIEPVVSRNVDPKTGAIPKGSTSNDAASQVDVEIQTNEAKRDSLKSISIETQTPSTILPGIPNQEQLQASVQKSIDIVQKSIENIQKTMGNNAQKVENEPAPNVEEAAQPKPREPKEIVFDVNTRRDIYPSLQATAPVLPTVIQSQANINAANLKKQQQVNFEPAVIVYDPNPKINAAVHTMMNMGFSNEDNWLTQLLINVDGDIAKALNFLTPQPKNRKP